MTEFVSRAKAAAYVGVHVQTLRRWEHRIDCPVRHLVRPRTGQVVYRYTELATLKAWYTEDAPCAPDALPKRGYAEPDTLPQHTLTVPAKRGAGKWRKSLGDLSPEEDEIYDRTYSKFYLLGSESAADLQAYQSLMEAREQSPQDVREDDADGSDDPVEDYLDR